MIQNFKNKSLKKLFEKGDSKSIHADHLEKIENILFMLNRARKPKDMNLPGLNPHPLKGKWKGFYAVTVQANWRILYRFHQGHVCDVDFIDYH